MSDFDTEEFLSTSVATAFDTRRKPLPEGEYTGVIDSVEVRKVIYRKGENAGSEGKGLDVFVTIDNVQDKIGQPSVKLRYSFLLDLTPSGGLDTSKHRNLRLGRLREAVEQNTDKPWNLGMLVGQPLQVRVKHRPDTNDPEVIYDEIASVAKMA
jgi:hypothetical protein